MMKLFPKTITGPLNAQNKGACDWGWQGILAYGCQNLVTIVDPKTVQVIQVLDKHKGTVTQVKWAHENYHHDLNSPYSLRLASADSAGVILVWDVAQGTSRTEFSDGNKPVQALEWLRNQDASRDLLLALHPPYSLILWNADTGTRLWKKSYTETLLSFSFDPFNGRNMAFLGQDCIIFVNDFTITKTPSSNGKKYYISNPSTQGMSRSGSSGSLDRRGSGSASKNLAKRMSRILVGDTKPSKPAAPDEESVSLNECLQLSFHQSCRHHILLLYQREILILDLQINQTVGIIAMDRASSPFTQVVSCWQRDVLICLHENGSLSVRVRRKTHTISTPAPEGHGAFDDTPPNVSLDVAYDLRCQSDPLRVTRHNRVYCASLCPVSEKSVALIMSDSRVIFWELQTSEIMSHHSSHVASPLLPPDPINTEGLSADDLNKITFPVISDIPPPILGLTDMLGSSVGDLGVKHGPGVHLKFLMTGLLNGISSHITLVRMCPPLTNKNWDIYEPILALGTYSGAVQLANAASGQIEKEYSLHTSTVRGIEWASLKHFLSYAFPNPGASGLVRNELLYVDTVSGKQTQLRTHKDEESPIDQIQVSYLKQYFLITFKDKPLELWDLRSQTIIRELPRSFPRPTSVSWSPSHSLKMKKKLLDSGTDDKVATHQKLAGEGDTPSVGITATHADPSAGKEKKNMEKVSVREHFVMTDKDCTVFHFIVEGSAISDVTKIPPESGLTRVTALGWKGDFLVFGDAEGVQCLWDLKAKISRTTPTNRGWIKKIRFAPGRENFKFFTLHNDGILIWDISAEGKAEVLHSVKSPKDLPKVVDIEWAGSDRPAVVTSHSCLQIMNLEMKTATSPIESWQLTDPLQCPYLLGSKASSLLKCLLQHQPWQDQFSFTLDGFRDEDKELQSTVNTHLSRLNDGLLTYLPMCRFGTAERCLLTARFFGDESEVHFWTVALHYLRTNKARPVWKSGSSILGEGKDRFVPQTPSYQEASDLVVLAESDDETERRRTAGLFIDQPLERCYDALCDNHSYKKYQLDRVSLHDSKRATYEHTQKCAENYMLLGQTDRAVQLLLETEAENESYYIDSLRACLVASVRSSGASQSTMKLVATNLIASARLSEGVQLLCLIDKGLDACRYLQTYGSWDQAVWLAKSTLDFNECSEVMKRWADQLCTAQVNQKSKALLVLLSLGQFHKVVEMLYSMRCFDRAACFIEACLQFGALTKTDDTGPLFEAVFLEYARYLINLGHGKAASHYCTLAGDKGAQLYKEVCILFNYS